MIEFAFLRLTEVLEYGSAPVRVSIDQIALYRPFNGNASLATRPGASTVLVMKDGSMKAIYVEETVAEIDHSFELLGNCSCAARH